MLENKEFLMEYLKTYTPSGMEHIGFDIWNEYAKQIVGDSNVDIASNNNTVANYNVDAAKKIVILEAHVDEISWRISKISEDGNISVIRNGGSDAVIAPSKTGVIHLGNGETIKGVFGIAAIHVRGRGNESAPKVEDLRFDTGYNKEELSKKGVRVGQIITFDDQPFILGDKYICGRALDNKLGGYIILEALKKFKAHFDKNNAVPSIGVIVANCISEEVGLYGARILAQELKAKYKDKISGALVVDVTHDTTVDKTNQHKEGVVKCGDGAVIEHSAQCHYNITKMFEEVAEENKIKYQHAIGGFGNDTVSFYETGINTAILAIPLKYMHTTTEVADMADINAIIDIFYHSLIGLNAATARKY